MVEEDEEEKEECLPTKTVVASPKSLPTSKRHQLSSGITEDLPSGTYTTRANRGKSTH